MKGAWDMLSIIPHFIEAQERNSAGMKTGRNEPCPCGSGKKYKKCCLLKEWNASPADTEKTAGTEDERLEMREMLTRAMHNWRRRLLARKPHIKAYEQLRKMHSEIVDAMVQYHTDGKFELKMDVPNATQRPGDNAVQLLESEYNLQTRVGAQGFYDVIIYKSAPNVNCLSEVFLEKHRYRKPEKVEMLRSMLASRLGLFEITAVDAEEGYAFLREVFTGDAYKITDVGLSGTTNCDELYLYTRVLEYDGIQCGTGLSLVFSKDDGFIEKFIRQEKQDYVREREFARFVHLYNHYAKQPDRILTVTKTRG